MRRGIGVEWNWGSLILEPESRGKHFRTRPFVAVFFVFMSLFLLKPGGRHGGRPSRMRRVGRVCGKGRADTSGRRPYRMRRVGRFPRNRRNGRHGGHPSSAEKSVPRIFGGPGSVPAAWGRTYSAQSRFQIGLEKSGGTFLRWTTRRPSPKQRDKSLEKI